MTRSLVWLAVGAVLFAACHKSGSDETVDAQAQSNTADASAAASASASATPPTPTTIKTPIPHATPDAGHDELCCCSAPQHKAEIVGQTECTTARGGQCVKNEQCFGGVQACCCQAPNHPTEMVGMSECNKGRSGKCVKANSCRK